MEINYNFYKKTPVSFKAAQEQDRVVYGYIRALAGEDCSEALRYDKRGFVRFHLAEERRSSVSWYPHLKDAAVLEIGADFGAVTGELLRQAKRVAVTEFTPFRARALQERYQDRDNLEIYVGEIEDIRFAEQFDVIVIFDMMNKLGGQRADEAVYIRRLAYLKQYLKPEGRLLLAQENPYALARCQGDNSALRPWKPRKGLHRAQIKTILQKAGYPYMEFACPLPDYKEVQMIYSDLAQPAASEWVRLMNPGCNDRQRLLAAADVMQPLLENQLFTHYAPAFFVEAAAEDILTPFGEIPVLCHNEVGYSAERQYLDQSMEAHICKIDEDHQVMEAVVAVEIDLLKKLKEVCDAHGLRFYLIYGTLLGAVRNAGMIPGDDDIDVAMPREDYDRLQMLTDEFSGKYFLQTPANDDCFYGGYLKLRDRETTAIHPQNWWVDCCEGIGIDIFPLDKSYANADKEAGKIRRIKHLQRMLYAKAYGYYPRFKDMKLPVWKAYKYAGKRYTRQQLAQRLDKALSEGDDGAPWGIYAHYQGMARMVYMRQEAFAEPLYFPYEGMLMPVPSDWENMLKERYGDHYMNARPWTEGKQRHGFYHPALPFQIYQKRFRLFRPRPAADTPVVLFGDGLLWDAYLKQYAEQYKPSALVSLWEQTETEAVQGIRVQPLNAFLKERPEKMYAVLCCVDIRGGEKRLQEAGISEYHIFLRDRNWMLLANYTFAFSKL